MEKVMLHTRFWHDEFVNGLSAKEKLLFLYLVTNEHVTFVGVYEIPLVYIQAATGITPGEVSRIKEKLQGAGKFVFHKSWVRIVNFDRYQNFGTGDEQIKGRERLLKEAPSELFLVPPFEGSGRGRGGVTEPSNPLPSNNTSTSNTGESAERGVGVLSDVLFHKELTARFPGVDIPEEVAKMKDWLAAKGRSYKDYRAFARNWLRRAAADVRLRGRQGGRGSVGRV